MKTLLLPLLALTLATGTATAQTQPANAARQGGAHTQLTPEERATRQSGHLSAKLGLTADQSARIRPIVLARSQEMQALRTQREQLHQQMKANDDKYDAQFKQVLTAEQYAQYTALKAERMNKHRAGHRFGRGTGEGATEKVRNLNQLEKATLKKADK